MTILPTLALRSFVGFDNLFNELESISNQKQSSFPAHDIIRISDDEYEITLAVSGFNKKDINIEVSDDVLSITGERTEDKVEDSDLYHYRERSRGTFTRSFHLPESVDEKKISANFKDGILNIELPKTKVIEPKSRKIKIS